MAAPTTKNDLAPKVSGAKVEKFCCFATQWIQGQAMIIPLDFCNPSRISILWRTVYLGPAECLQVH